MSVNEQDIIYFSGFTVSLGQVFIAKGINGICRISFPHVAEDGFLERLRKGLQDRTTIIRNDSVLEYEVNILQQYFSGKQVVFDFMLDMSCGTVFQRRVWEKLLWIPYGECRSYKWVAAQIGNPRAARAVGVASSKNPFAPVVPCHRVIGSSGGLTGYASGLHIKKALLEMERRNLKQLKICN